MTSLHFTLTKFIYTLVVVLKVVYLEVQAEEGCPPPEDIRPCVCYNSPHTVLQCTHIQNEKDLKDVFSQSKGYSYKQIHIVFATLKYIPRSMFENTVVKELYLHNSTLNALFDFPPDNLQSLYKLHVENTNIKELSNWELLQPLVHLRMLTIYYNPVEVISPSFSEYVTKDISQITFYATGTKHIRPGAFAGFKNLNRLSIDACQLKEISRDIFARPSNIKDIYFNNNHIKVIPDDMFVGMPNLKTVGLKENLLTTIPESAFGGNIGRLDWLLLEGNPLKCNCDLQWLVNSKPEYLSGSCATPIKLHDKPLKDLTDKDFKC